jgi:hypothetical protein
VPAWNCPVMRLLSKSTTDTLPSPWFATSTVWPSHPHFCAMSDFIWSMPEVTLNSRN